MTARFHLVTNMPRKACLDLFGTFPAPSWAAVLSTAPEIAALKDGDRAFGLFYGAPDCPEDRLFQSRLGMTRIEGMDASQIEGLRTWRLRSAPPGVVPALPVIDDIKRMVKDGVMVMRTRVAA